MAPNGWNKTYLKDIISGAIKNGYSPLPAASTTGYWVMSLGALTDNGINPTEIKPVEFNEKVKQALLANGDFLVSRSNTPDKVGRSMRFKGEVENCSYPDLMMKFRVNPEKADPNFIEIKLSSSEIRQYYKSCAAGSSSTMVKINKSVVENTPLLLPSLLEQKKIAQILSSWDQAIITTERLLDLARQQKKTLMQQLLTGKKRVLFFSQAWRKIKLERLIREVRKEKVDNPEVIELLTVRLHNKGVIPSGRYPNPTEGGRPYYRRNKGEIIVGRQNLHNGGVAIVSSECDGLIASNAISSFEVTSQANTAFILELMSTAKFKMTIDNLIGGTGQKEISTKELMKLSVLAPCVDEQSKIADILGLANREIIIFESQLDDLKQEKKALMQALLTGKRRVQLN